MHPHNVLNLCENRPTPEVNITVLISCIRAGKKQCIALAGAAGQSSSSHGCPFQRSLAAGAAGSRYPHHASHDCEPSRLLGCRGQHSGCFNARGRTIFRRSPYHCHAAATRLRNCKKRARGEIKTIESRCGTLSGMRD